MTNEIPAGGELLTLQVADKHQIAQGIHQFELRRPEGGELPEFTAGAHVAIHIPDGPIRK